MDDATQPCDTLVIGGGPGGLTAGIYLLRFRRSLALFDKGHSRLLRIPASHNYPGFPDGIRGAELLARLREQFARHGGSVTDGEVLSLERQDDCFLAGTTSGEVRARTVILASGIADGGMPIAGWNDAVAAGAIRLCPICDGYEVIGKKVALLAGEGSPVAHALFLRTFAQHVTLFDRQRDAAYQPEDRQRLKSAQVRHIASPVATVTYDGGRAVVHTEDGESWDVDVVYPMLGETPRSSLAAQLGAQLDDSGKLLVDQHQQTSVSGLFAVGDVVPGLNQISVAAGQAAVAATAVHNALPARYA